MPVLPQFRAQALSTRVYAFLLAMIDGERTIRDMARLMEQQKLMPADFLKQMEKLQGEVNAAKNSLPPGSLPMV